MKLSTDIINISHKVDTMLQSRVCTITATSFNLTFCSTSKFFYRYTRLGKGPTQIIAQISHMGTLPSIDQL